MSKAINILIVVVLISAIAMLLYPTISDQYSQYVNNRRILSYSREIDAIDPTANLETLEAARAYNESIKNTEVRDAFNEAAESTSEEYRAQLGVNQQELGKLVGVSRQTISQIERGDYSPSVTIALRLAKVCNTTVENIFEYQEDD